MAERECARCGAPMQATGRAGRPRKFCSDECKNRMPRERRTDRHRPRRFALIRFARCEACGALFHPTPPSARCCSKACANVISHRTRAAKSKARRTRSCSWCGKTFIAGGLDRLTYCSRECSLTKMKHEAAEQATRRRLIKVLASRAECTICGDVFVKRSVVNTRCSPECDAEHARRRALALSKARDRRDRSPRPCAECGIEFAPEYGNKRREYCSRECLRRSVKRIGKRIRRARMRGATADPVNPTKVFQRDGWRCQICGIRTPRNLRGTTKSRAPELDHIVPLASGGEHTYRNVQCACRSCNNAKGAGAGGQMLLFG